MLHLGAGLSLAQIIRLLYFVAYLNYGLDPASSDFCGGFAIKLWFVVLEHTTFFSI